MRKKVIGATAAFFIASSLSAPVSAATYEVKSGDSLWKIAKAHNTTVEKIKQLNNLAGDTVKLKQVLIVDGAPVPAPPAAKPAPPAAKPAPEAASPKLDTRLYTIQRGDNLSKIAASLKTTVAELKKINGLKTEVINAGQTIKIGKDAVLPPPPVVKPAESNPSALKHTIAPGDTLEKIAAKYKTTISALKELNGLKSDLIYAGQILKIGGSQAAAPSAPPASTTPSKPSAPSSPALDAVKGLPLIETAKSVLGAPYLWAGTTPAGFDCSGFIYYAFNASGNPVKRLSTDGYYDRSHYISNPQPGDLVFFENTYKSGISHMGIYLGGGHFIHADEQGVQVNNVEESYWKSKLNGYKRFY